MGVAIITVSDVGVGVATNKVGVVAVACAVVKVGGLKVELGRVVVGKIVAVSVGWVSARESCPAGLLPTTAGSSSETVGAQATKKSKTKPKTKRLVQNIINLLQLMGIRIKSCKDSCLREFKLGVCPLLV